MPTHFHLTPFLSSPTTHKHTLHTHTLTPLPPHTHAHTHTLTPLPPPHTGPVKPSTGPSDLLLKPWACKQCNAITTDALPAPIGSNNEATRTPHHVPYSPSDNHPDNKDEKMCPKNDKPRFFYRFLPGFKKYNKNSFATATAMPSSIV